MKYGLDLPNMGGAGDPRLLAEIAHEAEESGWDGVFIFDSVLSPEWDSQFPDDPRKRATVDPWITLAAMAMRTERVTLGTMITPLSRRRPWKVARETVTLDHLSNGRLVLPVGLGTPEDGGYMNVGEELDRRVRAEMLDEALDIVTGLWTGEPFAYEGTHYQTKEMRFEPRPVQDPRIPIWVVGAWPREKSMRRAVRYDGIVPVIMKPGEPAAPPGIPQIAKLIQEHGVSLDILDEVRAIRDYAQVHRDQRGDAGVPFEIVLEANSSASRSKQAAETLAAYEEAGATWYIEGIFSYLYLPPHDVDRMRERIRIGPPRQR